jgi:hypothetical protein
MGTTGETFVRLYFERQGCGPFGAGDHDLGTDLYVALRTDQRLDEGWLIGVQVKTGDSLLKNPVKHEGIDGFWYRFDEEHANYWRHHTLGHVLILLSADQSRAFWTPLDSMTIQPTGKRFKVFVPAASKLDEANLDDWFRLALRRRQELAYKGLAMSYTVAGQPKEEWARQALLVPRLVAPHVHLGRELKLLNWAEAAALCLQAQTDRWRASAEVNEHVPSIDEARVSDDAGWVFASFVYDWSQGLLPSSGEAPRSCIQDRHFCVPTRILLAIHRLDEQGPEAALRIIMGPVDSAVPEDLAWLALIRCRVLEEAGRWSDALGQIDEADGFLRGITRDDLTVDALRSGVVAARASHEFSYENFTQSAVAADNPVSWWRGQRIAGALEVAVEGVFKRRAQPNHFATGNDQVHNVLASAALTARAAGAWAAWRSIQGLIGRTDLLLSEQDDGHSLRSLRQSGDQAAVDLAVRICLSEGRVRAVESFVADLTPHKSTSSTLRADLTAIRNARDLVPSETKNAWALELAACLVGPGDLPMPSRFYMAGEIVDTLAALADCLTTVQVQALGDWLLEGGVDDERSRNAALRLAASLRTGESLRTRWLGKWRSQALQSHRRAVLLRLTQKETDARAFGAELLKAADLTGLEAVDRWTDLSLEEANGVLEAIEQSLRALRSDGSQIMIPATDRGQQLTALVLYGPIGERGWAALHNFLTDLMIYPGFKETAARLLLNNLDDIPGVERERVADGVSVAARQMREHPLYGSSNVPFSRTGHLEVLETALRGEGEEYWAVIVRMLSETSGRMAALTAAGLQPGGEMLLVGLLTDSDRTVRDWACIGLTRRVLASANAQPAWIAALTAYVKKTGMHAANLIREVAATLDTSVELPAELGQAIEEVLGTSTVDSPGL